MVYENQWKLGIDMLTSDNMLDAFTFNDVILAVHHNCREITPDQVRKQVHEILANRLEDMNYLLEMYLLFTAGVLLCSLVLARREAVAGPQRRIQHGSLIKSYPAFFGMLAGTVLLFFQHNFLPGSLCGRAQRSILSVRCKDHQISGFLEYINILPVGLDNVAFVDAFDLHVRSGIIASCILCSRITVYCFKIFICLYF